MMEYVDNGRIRYTYGGVVFIFCPWKNGAVTSWKLNNTCETSGTKVTEPTLLEKYDFGCTTILAENERHHERLVRLTGSTDNMMAKWTSHLVLVVNMSGSMRCDDVNRACCQSNGGALFL
jgi:hypothetical protein